MKDIKPGDVLIFKAGDDWVGKAIAWLTDSDVSHAAIMQENMSMAEMGASGIHTGPVEVQAGTGTLVLRLSPEKDAAPLVSATQKYIDCETRYDFPALGLLAGLIIYRRIRPTPKMVAITDIILRAACSALDRLIQAAMKKPGKAMVCSQLVYQVYEDCGKEYRLRIENGLLQKTFDQAALGNTICLAELAQDRMEFDMIEAQTDFPDDEQLAKELLQAFKEQETDDSFAMEATDFGALPSWCSRFLDRLEEFLEATQSELPIDALFITPADLAYRTKNLERIGEIELKRK